MRLPIPKPRFSLRLLLLAITLLALAFGTLQIYSHSRPLTEKEIESVKIGMTNLEVRWRVGAPHRVLENTPQATIWRFDYTDSEGRKYQFLKVTFHESRVTQVEREAFISGFMLDVF